MYNNNSNSFYIDRLSLLFGLKKSQHPRVTKPSDSPVGCSCHPYATSCKLVNTLPIFTNHWRINPNVAKSSAESPWYDGDMKTSPENVSKEQLLALAEKVPGAWIGIKIATLLSVREGQRPS
jgi:hypothetical protein